MKAQWWSGACGVALTAGLFTAGLYIGEHFAHAENQSPAPAATRLGSKDGCTHYAGLPSKWGQDRRAGMVHIPGGEFVPGTTLGYEDERPVGAIKVSDFWIDQTEVTVAQFATFVKATRYLTDAEREGGGVVFHKPSEADLARRPYAWWNYVKGADWRHPTGPGSAADDNQPVILVTQADALAYARWLGRDLPTEAQWEYAAKAGQQGANLEKEPRDSTGKPAANYWQGAFPIVNTVEDGYDGLAPVGCYAANDFRLYDMIGNAWEWTIDPYSGPHQSHLNGDTSVVAAEDHSHKAGQPTVIKGGSYLCSRDFCVRYRASAREAQEANLPTSHIGFRTIAQDG